jgi:hypothetical protein
MNNVHSANLLKNNRSYREILKPSLPLEGDSAFSQYLTLFSQKKGRKAIKNYAIKQYPAAARLKRYAELRWMPDASLC